MQIKKIKDKTTGRKTAAKKISQVKKAAIKPPSLPKVAAAGRLKKVQSALKSEKSLAVKVKKVIVKKAKLIVPKEIRLEPAAKPMVETPPAVIPQEAAPPKAAIIKPPEIIPPPTPKPVRQPPPPKVHPKEKPAIEPPAPVVSAFPAPSAPPAAPGVVSKKEGLKVIEVNIPVVLKDLASSIQEKPAALIKKLLEYKIISNINQPLEEEVARKIAAQYGYQIKRKPTEEELLFREHEIQDASKLKPRATIVTFMGHVDHGKTSLLDAIRKSKVVDGEYGGITQHIGAYELTLPAGKITFLDTPGHEAFTAMRARGAKATDIVVLVVAADDGVMPQTVEAIDHAREANVPILVAINKIDKTQADIEGVKKELSKLNLVAEDWGGTTITVGVSAKTGEGIDSLLEMILLEAEMLELKADPDKLAKGVVLEAKITEGRGTVATLLVEDGRLHAQDAIIIGPHYAKIRAMFNEFGKPVNEALPSAPVEILGLSGLPEAGEQFFALSDEKKAKELAARRREQLREKALKPIKMMSLEDFSGQIKEGKVKELKIILKADVGGSLEAIEESFKKLENTEVKLNIIHQGVGSINVADIVLAEASGAIIMGFSVECDERSKKEAEKSGVDIRTYNIIYELYNDLKTALEGLLEPKLKKIFLGRLIVRKVFKLTKAGIVAGCYVEKGRITRAGKVTLLRNAGVIFEGAISSLKRFKDDVREVSEGMECGVSLPGWEDIMQGDVIEAYEIERTARKLD